MINRKMLALLVALLPLPAFAQDQPLRVVTSFEVASMDPLEEGFWMAEFGVGELLMRFMQDGAYHPWLLESLANPDELTWVLTLRPNLKFQNGKTLNAAAVMAAINHQLENSSSARGTVPMDAAFAATGDLEITIKTEKPWPTVPGVLSSEAVFLIYDVDAVIAAAGDFTKLVGAGIYSGPYAVTELDANHMSMVRNETYWQGQPAMPGVELSFVSDPNARILAVQNGEADIALYPPIALKPVVDATPGIHFVHGTPGTSAYVGFMNIAAAPFDDVRARQALMLAIDYDEIANTVFGGVLQQATSLYNPLFPFAVENYRTDTAAAGALLDGAGWTMGANGIRQKDGQDLAINLIIYPQQPDLVPMSNAIQAELQAVGMAVAIQSSDDIYAAMSPGGLDWDFGITAEGPGNLGIPEPFLRRYLADGSQRNFAGYDNDELQGLIDTLSSTVDPAARNTILQRIQVILVEEDPYVFSIVHQKGRAVVNDAYAGYQPAFALFHLGWDTKPSPAN
jgi:peptide/nickel transport system substrate-binding protein